MKGITPVIAIILLLLITIAITGFAFIFFSRSAETAAMSGEEQLKQQITQSTGNVVIQVVGPGKVYVRNIGSSNVNSLSLYMNNQKLNAVVPVIKPAEMVELDSIVVPGSSKIKAVSGIFEDSRDAYENVQYYDYDNFESGPGSTDEWNERNGVDPDITSVTAYSGKYSLHMPSSWGRNFEDGNNIEPGQNPDGYLTKDFPYLCMAYKVPAATKFNMLIRLENDNDKCNDPWGTWCAIPDGEVTGTATQVATWAPVIKDNNWHYKCINLHEALNQVIGSAINHKVKAIIWHDRGNGGVSGEFWIDDFITASIS